MTLIQIIERLIEIYEENMEKLESDDYNPMHATLSVHWRLLRYYHSTGGDDPEYGKAMVFETICGMMEGIRTWNQEVQTLYYTLVEIQEEYIADGGI
jgi:hypothetical protein